MNLLQRMVSVFRFGNCIQKLGTGPGQMVNAFHTSVWASGTVFSQAIPLTNNALLRSTSLISVTFRGMKVKKEARKRCPYCYLIHKDGRVFNYCKVKPRHKHASIIPKDRERLIITHRTFRSRRPY